MDIETGQEEYEEKAMGNCTIITGCGARTHHEECPENHCEGRGSGADCDRGSFGMPGLGVGRVINFSQSEPVITIKHDGVDVDYGTEGYTVGAQTHLARRILRKHLPMAMEHFLKRNAEYGDDDDFNLGSAGQYVDISRKVQKLKRRMWDGRPEKDGEESTETIVMELIGHLFMTLAYLEDENAKDDGQG